MRSMIEPLRAVWTASPASPAPPKRVWRDWALIVLLPALILLEGLLRPALPNLVPALTVTIAVVATLLWRRTRPFLMFAIGFGALEGFALVTSADADSRLYSTGYLVLLVYAVFRWGSGRALLVGGALMVAETLTSAAFAPFDLANLVGGLLVLLLTASVGLLLRFRAGSRVRELDRAKSREREELARDLHDTVAHHVSAIAIQAQAGLVAVAKNPDAATAALRVIETEASRTLAEMRSMVRSLRRDNAAELAPAPTLLDLHELARSDRGGPAIDVRVTGPFEELSGPVTSALYRIAQESVTNARRHARSANRIDVHIDVDAEWVRLNVNDDGAPGPLAVAGYGITGMTERVTLLGGAFTAGYSPDSGWSVLAELPRNEGAA